MDGAAHIAEHDTGGQRPRAPQQQAGADAVGARRRTGDPQPAQQDDQCGRQQPGDLSTELAAEHPMPAGRTAEHPTGTGATTAACATEPTTGGRPLQILGDAGRKLPTGLTAGAASPAAVSTAAEDPSEPVVAEGQLKETVVGRAADERSGILRPQLHGRHEPARGDQHSADAGQQAQQPPADRGRSCHQVHKPERRYRQERLHHLGQEGEPDRHARQGDPPVAAVLGRAHHTVGGDDQQQREQRIGVVKAEHQHGNRRQGQHGTGNETRARPDPTANRKIEDAHGRHALQRVRYEHAPATEAEDPPGQGHDPQ